MPFNLFLKNQACFIPFIKNPFMTFKNKEGTWARKRGQLSDVPEYSPYLRLEPKEPVIVLDQSNKGKSRPL